MSFLLLLFVLHSYNCNVVVDGSRIYHSSEESEITQAHMGMGLKLSRMRYNHRKMVGGKDMDRTQRLLRSVPSPGMGH
ncbi:hypothetical protein SUGI_0266730 [Cryptomeria japonica]|nr:hypothetical protein SUGI_0266730 [Cryptomeria japonica]